MFAYVMYMLNCVELWVLVSMRFSYDFAIDHFYIELVVSKSTHV